MSVSKFEEFSKKSEQQFYWESWSQHKELPRNWLVGWQPKCLIKQKDMSNLNFSLGQISNVMFDNSIKIPACSPQTRQEMYWAVAHRHKQVMWTWYDTYTAFPPKLAGVHIQKSPIDPFPLLAGKAACLWSRMHWTQLQKKSSKKNWPIVKESSVKNLALGCTSGVYNRGRVYFWGRPAGSLTCWGFRVILHQSGGVPGEEQLCLCSSLIEMISQSGVLMRGQRGQRM